MNQPKLLLLVLLVVSVCVYPQQQDLALDQNGREVLRKTEAAIVGIRCVAKVADAKGNTFEGHFFGTGAFVSDDGLVLTNITVAPENTYHIRLFLEDGRVIPASLVKIDKTTETALLQAEGKGFSYLPLVYTRSLKIGSCVYTVGNPYHSIEQDVQVAIARGIVSGIYKVTDNGDNESHYDGLVIETNAAVNPGSDGGPLVDHLGRLVGILSLAFQKERRMGTAIPAHLIAKNFPQLANLPLHKPEFTVVTPAQRVAEHAEKLAENFVAIEIQRKDEKSALPEKQPSNRMEMQQYLQGMIMQRPPGLITGIAIDEGKYVITSAYHVSHSEENDENSIDKLIEKILVYPPQGGEAIVATLVARHNPYDLALLKLEKPLAKFASIGDSSALAVGSWVGIAGRQRDSDNITLTTGIVSSTTRNYNLVHLYQTQAFTNYANSGGPVIDTHGNIVGMANFVQPDVVWVLNSGVGVFVDAATIAKILPEMKQGKSTKTPSLPFLGVGLWVDRKPAMGALISTVTLGSAAYAAGVKPGDILISLGRKPVGEWSDLVRLITSRQIGQEIEFEVIRDGKTIQLTAKLGRRPF